jgi:dihydrofolate reductase
MTEKFIDKPIDAAVAHAQQAAGDRNVVILGANVAHQCLDSGLLDEIVVHLAPVLLGDGLRLFGSPGTGRIDVERTSVAQSGQPTDLRFRVMK